MHYARERRALAFICFLGGCAPFFVVRVYVRTYIGIYTYVGKDLKSSGSVEEALTLRGATRDCACSIVVVIMSVYRVYV